MNDLTVDEVDRLTNRCIADLDSLSHDEAYDAVRMINHWPSIRDKVIQDAEDTGEIVGGEDARATFSELHAAQNDLKNLRDELAEDADRLQEAIVERRTDDALAILREMFPVHPFLTPAAEKMLAGIRGQGVLAL